MTFECHAGVTALAVIDITALSTALCIILTTAISALLHMKSESNVNIPLMCLFWMAVPSYSTLCVLFISAVITCLYSKSPSTAYAIIACSTWLSIPVFISLLGTLLVRLYITFDHSAYKVSGYMRHGLNALFVVMVIANVIQCILFMMLQFGNYSFHHGFYDEIALAVFLASYVVCALCAVAVFCSKLLKLAESQTSLSRREKWTNMSAKYVSLFCLAMFSTCVLIIIGYSSGRGHFGILLITFSFDWSINTMCLYLQYSFSSKQYNKYCSKLDLCCKAFITRAMKRRRARDRHQVVPTDEFEQSVSHADL